MALKTCHVQTIPKTSAVRLRDKKGYYRISLTTLAK